MTRTTHPTVRVHATPGDRLLRRWLSFGGLLTAIGAGNLVAALNWNAISRGTGDFRAVAATDRYAIWGFLFLVLGQAVMTRRTILESRRADDVAEVPVDDDTATRARAAATPPGEPRVPVDDLDAAPRLAPARWRRVLTGWAVAGAVLAAVRGVWLVAEWANHWYVAERFYAVHLDPSDPADAGYSDIARLLESGNEALVTGVVLLVVAGGLVVAARLLRRTRTTL
ncbi:hypothetical protein OMK64_02910 [Cellulomonas fimi]|uniref:hypothetical protein n=1 Tax=Cellulomonas fimi TaxID=1708 RepID=UPI00234DCFD6|nr:hypothetical protein [Cellulomonas fimi]MDC7120480.1 hypothetical protein [Cellulomonas fimi]